MTVTETEVEAYVAEVVGAVDALVPVAGAYVLGSALLGGFDPDRSDLDMVVVVERSPAAFEREAVIGALDELPPPVRKLELIVYPVGARPPAYGAELSRRRRGVPVLVRARRRDRAGALAAVVRAPVARAARAGDGSRDASRGEGVAPLGR